MKRLFIAGYIFFSFSLPAAADNLESQTALCVSCHGVGGNAPIADYPKLAGQDSKYLLYALRAYKSGIRANAIMAAQMAALTDEDLQKLASYFANQLGDLR